MATAGPLLAYLTRPNRTPISIPRIITTQGKISDTPGDFMETFLDFYKSLYTSRVDYTEAQLNKYLADISLPSLMPEGRDELEAPISADEIDVATSQLPTHKTPGLDCFPAELDTQFKELLCPFLLHTYNKSLDVGALPSLHVRSSDRTTIKTPQRPSYRSISLINMDVKILAKVLANRLNTVVNSDQGVFIPG